MLDPLKTLWLFANGIVLLFILKELFQRPYNIISLSRLKVHEIILTEQTYFPDVQQQKPKPTLETTQTILPKNNFTVETVYKALREHSLKPEIIGAPTVEDVVEVALPAKSTSSVKASPKEVPSENTRQSKANKEPSDTEFNKMIETTAMKVVMEYEKSQGRAVEDISATKVGYDLLSYDSSANPSVRRIEVKGKATRGSIVLTYNEWESAKEHLDAYFIYIVEDANSDCKKLRVIQNPYKKLQVEVSKVQYVLPRSIYKSV